MKTRTREGKGEKEEGMKDIVYLLRLQLQWGFAHKGLAVVSPVNNWLFFYLKGKKKISGWH